MTANRKQQRLARELARRESIPYIVAPRRIREQAGGENSELEWP